MRAPRLLFPVLASLSLCACLPAMPPPVAGAPAAAQMRVAAPVSRLDAMMYGRASATGSVSPTTMAAAAPPMQPPPVIQAPRAIPATPVAQQGPAQRGFFAAAPAAPTGGERGLFAGFVPSLPSAKASDTRGLFADLAPSAPGGGRGLFAGAAPGRADTAYPTAAAPAQPEVYAGPIRSPAHTGTATPVRSGVYAASAPSRPATYAAITAAPARYTLDTGDRLRITVFGQEGLTNSYSVDAGGNINVSLIGSVRARGLTTAELSGAIAARLRNGYIREPHVAVEVEAHRPFFILGEVTTPGQYPFVANMSVETAVAIAGGFTPRAQRDRVTVSRTVNGQAYRGGVPASFPLQPGDTIVVGERWF